jgi:hypothetical protein
MASICKKNPTPKRNPLNKMDVFRIYKYTAIKEKIVPITNLVNGVEE